MKTMFKLWSILLAVCTTIMVLALTALAVAIAFSLIRSMPLSWPWP